MMIRDNKILAITLVILSTLSMSAMDATAKMLVTDYPVMQVLAIRGWIVLAVLLAYGTATGGTSSFKTTRYGGHFLRMVAGIAAPSCFFVALKYLPLADIIIIFFGGTFVITALSYPVLKERVGLHRTAAVVVGFLGVSLVVQPSGGVFQWAALVAALGSVCYAITTVVGRKLSDTEDTFKLVFSTNLGIVLGASLFLPFQWTPMLPIDLGIVFLMTGFGLVGHICIIKAFSLAEVGSIAPFEYTGVIWAVLFGFFLWGDIPTPNVVTGAAFVVGAGLYIIYRDVRPRRNKPPLDIPNLEPTIGQRPTVKSTQVNS